MDFKSNRLARFLGSVRLTLALLLLLAVVTATATLIEAAHGTAYAQAVVYRAWWFEAILILLAVNMIVMFPLRWPFGRHQTGFVITHISVLIILAGAGITRYFGYEGVMTIREGSSSNFLYSREDHLEVRVGDASAHEEVELYAPGQSLERALNVNGETFAVEITEYWPHVREEFANGPGGEHLLSMAATENGSTRQLRMRLGETASAGHAQIRFAAELAPPAEGTGRGLLVASLGGEIDTFAVPSEVPATVSVGGHEIELSAFHPNFRVGREPDPSAPMRNPALEVRVPTDGEPAERLLFALHPQFDFGDSLVGWSSDLGLRYTWSQGLQFAPGTGDAVRVLAGFPLTVTEAGDPREIPAREAVAVGRGATIEGGGVTLHVHDYWASAVRRPRASKNPQDPPGAWVRIRDETGNEASSLVYVRRGEETLALGDRRVAVSLGPIRIPVGYDLHLDDFVLVTYPGSENPASFESHVRIHDPERGVEGRPFRIHMNRPLTYRGFKYFQSSYDSDRKGTVLSVNNDPGTLPTYIGYTLLTVGFLITLTRGLLWYRQPARARVTAYEKGDVHVAKAH